MIYHTLNNNRHFRLTWTDYLLAFMFALLGGFQNAGLIPAKTYILGGLGLYYFMKHPKDSDRTALVLCLLSYVLVGILHIYVYHYASKRTLLELPLLILSGYFIIRTLGWKFRYALLQVMTVLAGISIVFYFAMVLFDYVPHSPLSTSMYPGNALLYVVRYNEIRDLRNCGPYWEPGAFGGYIIMTFIFFFDSLSELWKKYRKHVIILVIAMIATRSTQTYLCAFLLLIFYLWGDRFNMKTVILSVALIAVSFVAYTSLPFLRDKVNEQLELTADWEDDNSLRSANRFTTTMLDIHYINKNPWIGNTDKPKKRYVDHPFVLRVIEDKGGYGSGSGITNNLATYGLLPFLIWLLFSYKKFYHLHGAKKTLLLLLILLALGQGEQYSNAIFYLSLPFLCGNKINIPRNR